MNLSLRYIDNDDLNDIARLANDRDIAKTMASLPYPYTLTDAKTWLDYVVRTESEHVFAIVNKKHFMGVVGLVLERDNNRAELGYWLGRQFWNKGFASGAVQMILGYAFSVLNVNKVYAQAFGTNAASHKVLEKNGFVLEGCLKDHYVRMGETHDVLYYGLQKSSFDNKSTAK